MEVSWVRSPHTADHFQANVTSACPLKASVDCRLPTSDSTEIYLSWDQIPIYIWDESGHHLPTCSSYVDGLISLIFKSWHVGWCWNNGALTNRCLALPGWCRFRSRDVSGVNDTRVIVAYIGDRLAIHPFSLGMMARMHGLVINVCDSCNN